MGEDAGALSEARIAIEAAIVVADLVALTEIVQSRSFDQLVIYLHDAVEALAKIEGETSIAKPQHTIFPSADAANAHVSAIEPGTDIAYRLSRYGDGKCVVQVIRLAGLL